MAVIIGLVILSLISTALCNVIYYQPEAVHLAYGGNMHHILFIIFPFHIVILCIFIIKRITKDM